MECPMKIITKTIALLLLVLSGVVYADNAAGLAAINAGNYKLALQEFQEAANQGNIEATYNLALMYDRGLGVSENKQKAATFYQTAAKQGYTSAMLNLGTLYVNGVGISQDTERGIYWYQEAYKHGEKGKAAYAIGLIYYYGRGTQPNYSQSIKYFSLGANAGNSLSMEMLGTIYLNGQGVKPDYQQAYNYFYKAKILGDKDAEQGLAQLYAKLTPQQIQQLQNGTFKMSELNTTS